MIWLAREHWSINYLIFRVHPGLYFAHIGDVHVTFRFVRNIGAACCGGGGFLLLKLSGTGVVFLNGGGTIMEKFLAPGEKLLVDTNSLVAFAETAQYFLYLTLRYGIKQINGFLNCCFGGEGCFNTEVTGPGI